MRVEFAVNVSEERDLLKVKETLKKKGINLADSNLATKSVHFEIDHKNLQQPNIQELQKYVEDETGYTTVVKGLGQLSSAVAELRPPSIPSDYSIYGVVRLSQQEDGGCLVDGSIGALRNLVGSQRATLAIHEYGDLSDSSFSSIGARLVVIDGNCSTSVKKSIPNCDVASLIGRSIALSGGQPSRVLSAGIVARASTVEANTKQICSCSGKTLWQERLEERNKHGGSS